MSVNVLELAKTHLNNAALEKLSDYIGENSANVKTALGAILPAILGGIVEKASTSNGVIEIMGILRKQDCFSLTDDSNPFCEDSVKIRDMELAGARLIPVFLSGKESTITDSVASFSGMKSDSATSLLSWSASFLISVIGNHFEESGMGLSGLTNLLADQKDIFVSALRSHLASIPDLVAANDVTEEAETQYSESASAENTSGWLLWSILILFLIGGGVWGWKHYQKERGTAFSEPTVVVDSTISGLGDTTGSVTGGIITDLENQGVFIKKKLPSGVELNVPEMGVENKLIKFIEDSGRQVDKTTWFNFDRVIFETGSGKLSKESLEQVKNLADILKAFPNVKLKIGGYTDNTGDAAAHLRTSSNRANAVRVAIEKEGVGNGRLVAEGYGKEHPVASNDTEQGRAQNRRIAVLVIRK